MTCSGLWSCARAAARLARVVSQELGRTFRRQDIADAIKLCFDRTPDFVTDYMEENFNLVPRTVVTSDVPQAAATESAANVSRPVTDSPEIEPSTLEVAVEEPAASGSVDAEADNVATSEEAPARHRHQAPLSASSNPIRSPPRVACTYRGSRSMAYAIRPVFCAAITIVPLPTNGS